MGSCFTKTTTAPPPPPPRQFDVKSQLQPPQNSDNDQQLFKKEIFVIKHRISHESDRHTDKEEPHSLNPSATAGDGESRNAGGARLRTSSCRKEEVDATVIQCGRLSRSNSAGAQNPRRKRRYSRSKRSFDFDFNTRLDHSHEAVDVNYYDNGDDDGGLNRRRRQQEVRSSSPSSSRERDPRPHRSTSRERGSRRISISPSRRSESPFRNPNASVLPSGSGGSKPAMMVSVPATDKSNNTTGSVKRIHVKRNVGSASPYATSPAKKNLQIFTDNPSHDEPINNKQDEDKPLHQRKSLAEIDNNATRSLHPSNPKLPLMVPKRTGRLSKDLDHNPEGIPDPSPPSYASFLLQDIHNFHQKNTNPPPDFSLPECVTKACSIMEAVESLTSNTNSFSDDKRRNPTPISESVVNDELEGSIRSYVTVKQGRPLSTEEQESSGSNSISSLMETNTSKMVTRERDIGPFPRGLMDYPRKGIGRFGRRSTVAST